MLIKLYQIDIYNTRLNLSRMDKKQGQTNMSARINYNYIQKNRLNIKSNLALKQH